jgi:hypothetical protein
MTNECVVMVSDRRLTNADTGEVITGIENKALILSGHLMMGYTGIARLGGVPTIEWVIGKLAGKQLTENFRVLETESASAVRSFPQKYRQHAYLAAGWLLDSKNEYVPVAFITSNFIQPNGTMLSKAAPNFTTFKVLLPHSNAVVVLSAGARVPDTLKIAACRTIRRYRKQNRYRPQGIVQILGDALLSVAGANNSVGRDVMVTSFPRAAAPITEIVMAFHDRSWETQLIARYVGQDSQVMQYVPAMVSADLANYGAEVWTERPPWWHE